MLWRNLALAEMGQMLVYPGQVAALEGLVLAGLAAPVVWVDIKLETPARR
jgi:hypothetical protein